MPRALHSKRKKPTVMQMEKWLVGVVPNTTSCTQHHMHNAPHHMHNAHRIACTMNNTTWKMYHILHTTSHAQCTTSCTSHHMHNAPHTAHTTSYPAQRTTSCTHHIIPNAPHPTHITSCTYLLHTPCTAPHRVTLHQMYSCAHVRLHFLFVCFFLFSFLY